MCQIHSTNDLKSTGLLLHSQVINLLHVHTLEMRGLRPEASAHSLLALMQLFEGRLAALRALSEPLVYHSQNLAHLVSWSVHRHMEEYKVDIADADIEQVLGRAHSVG